MRNQHRLFLMNGDALILRQRKLAWILDMINEHLPWVRRVGAYAKTLDFIDTALRSERE